MMAALVLLALPISAQEVLRGEVKIELEQAGDFSSSIMEKTRSLSPLTVEEARTMAVEEAARYFGGMIYGWSFRYEVGERARNIAEELELTPLASIAPDDPRLEPADVQIKDGSLYLWVDYRPQNAQRHRLAAWKAGSVRSVQGYGQSPLDDKAAALKDAARAALRAMLRGSERNRPKQVTGYISLAAFPRYWLDKGQWAAQGRFLVAILEIRPFAAY